METKPRIKRNCFILLLEYLDTESFRDTVKDIPYTLVAKKILDG